MVLDILFQCWGDNGHDHLPVLCDQADDVVIVPHEECSLCNLKQFVRSELTILKEQLKSSHKPRDANKY